MNYNNEDEKIGKFSDFLVKAVKYTSKSGNYIDDIKHYHNTLKGFLGTSIETTGGFYKILSQKYRNSTNQLKKIFEELDNPVQPEDTGLVHIIETEKNIVVIPLVE